jgi:O-antigen ligase
VLLSFSRSAWLALLLGAAAVLVVARDGRPSPPKAAGRILVTVAVAAFVLVTLVRVESLGSLVERNSIDTRTFYNTVAWRVIGHGVPVGAGNLVVAQQHLLGAAAAGSEPAHDVFVIALAELGPFGLVAWFAILGSLLLASWLRRGDPHGRAGPLVAVAVLAPLLVFDHYLWTQPAGRALTVLTLVVLTSRLRGLDIGSAPVATPVSPPRFTARSNSRFAGSRDARLR